MATRDEKIRIEVFAPAGQPLSAPADSGKLDESVLRLARLLGRQMAREQFERQQTRVTKNHGSSRKKQESL